MDTSDIIAIIAAIIAAISAAVAIISTRAAIVSARATVVTAKASEEMIKASKEALEVNVKMFRRQSIVELHMALSGIKGFDPTKPYSEEALKVVNALGLIATLWNHEIVEPDILYQVYADAYRDTCEKILNSPAKNMLTKEMMKTYDDMKKRQLTSVQVTTIKP